MVGILTETSITQQLIKMYVKQSNLVAMSKAWSFTKEKNLYQQLKMAKLFSSQRREFQCQDIKLATLKVLWKDPDHFVFYATFTTLI